MPTMKELFPLGRTVATPAALAAIAEAGQTPADFLARHEAGDWGGVSPDDAKENELSLKEGSRLMSIYWTAKEEKLYVITEADRSSTCIMLPEEY